MISHRTKTVLVVEDQAINRRIIGKILSEEYNIIEAENGKEGLLMLEEHPEIAAVMLDIVMPVMNGYEFLQVLPKTRFSNLPVIVMTGESDPASEETALDAGAWDFVTKPYRARVIMGRLKNAIARSEVALYEKMRYLSEHDPLTGLYNRRRVFKEAKAMMDAHPENRFVFLRIDIDRFKLYNSSFGEQEGDQLLCHVANLILDSTMSFPMSICGKIDADIFCVCENYDEKKIEEQVARISAELSHYREDYLLEVSCGAYIVQDTSLPIETMYGRASMASQKCKHQYMNTLAFYDDTQGRRSSEEIEIINEMQTALREEQFALYFQPKVNPSTNTPCGAEALVRWLHPVKGLISPGLFIPVFEKNGFIAQLDDYVWDKTCRFLRRWIDEGGDPDPVSVNVSRVSLYNPNIAEVFSALIRKYHLPAALLQLEVTESAYMSNPELMRTTISRLHAAGFTILMDDFGSGYSSLNTLKEIDVDILKFDMKFLPTGSDLAKGEIILMSILRMAGWLGMTVVVEGVETRKQRDFLEGIGCDYIQGYFYSRPIPAEDYERGYVFKKMRISEGGAPTSDNAESVRDRILVVDDNEQDRHLLSEYFGDRFTVDTCGTAEDAILLMRRRQNYCLMLVDHYLPGMSGLDFLEYARFLPALACIPKIIITADTHPQDQITAFRRGAYDYITKPFVREVVVARAEHALNIVRRIYKNNLNTLLNHSSADMDTLTGMMKKDAYRRYCEQLLETSPDDKRALLLVDVDHFAKINAAHGHPIGDEVLSIIAEEIKVCFRRSDVAGRCNGDEFIIMMTDLPGMERARLKAEELLRNITAACEKRLSFTVTASIGLAQVNVDDVYDSVLARADQALYDAKHAGRNRVCIST